MDDVNLDDFARGGRNEDTTGDTQETSFTDEIYQTERNSFDALEQRLADLRSDDGMSVDKTQINAINALNMQKNKNSQCCF